MDVSTDPQDYFHSWTPIEPLLKSLPEEEDAEAYKGYIGGVVSTEMVDFQGEKVMQKGLTWDYFLEHGWFNDNHDSSILGYPTAVTPGDGETRVEGYLLLEKARAKDLYETAVALKKAGDERKLGYSIEGKIVERDKEDPSVVLRADVYRVALTEHPVNPGTSLEPLIDFAKSLSAGYQTPAETTGGDNGPYSPLMRESLGSQLVREYKDVLEVFRNMAPVAKSWERAEEIYKACGKDVHKACSMAKEDRPARREMPQLSKGGMLRVISRLRKEGYAVKAKTVDPRDLEITQKSINGPKVREMVKAVKSFAGDRIITSQDKKILDGHHRVAALKKAGLQAKIYEVPLLMKDLLRHPAVQEEGY